MLLLGDYVVIKSACINDLREARRYYAERLSGSRVVSCFGREATLVFGKDTNHTYTEECPDDTTGYQIVRTKLKGGIIEERVLCLDRARLMDAIVPAVCHYTYAMASEGPPGFQRQLVHGQRLPDGRYLRVVLRGDDNKWRCLSAYPITSHKWMQDRGAAGRFPP